MQEKFEVEFDGWNATEQVPAFVQGETNYLGSLVNSIRAEGKSLLDGGLAISRPVMSVTTMWGNDSEDEQFEVFWELVVKSNTAFLQGFNSDTGEYFYTQDLGI